MKAPTSVKEVRRFLVMCGFYRKHVPSFAKIATPLSNSTKAQVKFQRTEACHQASERLKSSLINPPILVKAQLDQPFIVTTDASKSHVGGVLSQIQDDNTNKPIGYFSKKLNPYTGVYCISYVQYASHISTVYVATADIWQLTVIGNSATPRQP